MAKRFGYRYALGLLLGIVFVFVAHHAFAQTTAFQQLGTATILPKTPLPIIIARIIRAVLGVLGVVLTILILYAGFMYMTAGGEPEKTQKAKAIIKNAIIGLVIVLSSFLITQFILSRLEQALGLTGNITSTASSYSEPLGAGLNGRVIVDQYPPRDAVDSPRNTRIMVTFVDAIKPDGIISCTGTCTPDAHNIITGTLNSSSSGLVKVGPSDSADATDPTLDTTNTTVVLTSDRKTLVIKPNTLLGNANTNTNYTVTLKPGIQNLQGVDIFTNNKTYQAGYSWTFQVSTKIDLTPPHVISIAPQKDTPHDDNATIEITFSKPMDPTTVAGSYKDGSSTDTFDDIQVTATPSSGTPAVAGATTIVDGHFDISNGYQTVDFTTYNACAVDNCGDTIYCLPGPPSVNDIETIHVLARAATIDTSATGTPPQSKVPVDGVEDTSGNSLDGDGDGKGEGPNGNDANNHVTDNFAFSFTTTGGIDSTTPQLNSITPKVYDQFQDVNVPVTFTFNSLMKTSTLTNVNIQLWPFPYYPTWFAALAQNVDDSGVVPPLNSTVPDPVTHTVVKLNHPPLVSLADGGHDYYPIVTKGVLGNNQFCFYPAVGPEVDTTANGTCTGSPFCCPQESGDVASSDPNGCKTNDVTTVTKDSTGATTTSTTKGVYLPLTPCGSATDCPSGHACTNSVCQ